MKSELPLLIMLLAGAIAAILLKVGNYDLKSFLIILLLVLILFYAIGSGVYKVIDTIDKQNKKKAAEEEAVIEKTPEESETGKAEE